MHSWRWFTDYVGTRTVVSGCGPSDPACTMRITTAGAYRYNAETDRYEVTGGAGWTRLGVQVNDGGIWNNSFRYDHFKNLGRPAPAAGGLDIRINPIGSALPGGTFPLRVVLRNTSTTDTLTGITPVNKYGFGVANSYYPAAERGEIQVVSGPQPAFPSSLAPGAQSVHTITMKAVKFGKVGLEAKATAAGPSQQTDSGYGEVEIAETQPNDAERTAMVATGTSLFMSQAKQVFRDQQARYALALYKALSSRLSDKAKKFYFGALNKLKITDYERALARWRGMAPELTAITTPNKPKLFENGNVYMNEEQFARFQQMHNAEMLRLTGEYLGGAYDTVAHEASYWAQVASVEGQGRIAADLALWREYNAQSGDDLMAALRESATLEGASRALKESDAALRSNFEKAVNGLLAAREARIGELTNLAEKDPDAFFEQLSKDTAGMGFEGFKLVTETLMGEAAFTFAGKVFTGVKAAMTKFTKIIGAGTRAEAEALARTTVVGERTATLGPTYLDDLDDDAKTLIALRKMEDIGGMPVGDVEITKKIIAGVNKRMKALGYDVEVEVLFRPANPYKVAGSFAKVEAVGVKNIAPIDLALGAPPSTLAETAIFKPVNPKTLPGWASYSSVERTLLEERYKTRLSEFKQFFGFERAGLEDEVDAQGLRQCPYLRRDRQGSRDQDEAEDREGRRCDSAQVRLPRGRGEAADRHQ